MHPRARTDDVLIETFPEEVLVCDAERSTVHSLRPLAALVWRGCDGATSPRALAAAARSAGFEADEAAVMLALDRLAEAGLVTGWERPRAGVSRRSALKAAAALAGVVTVLGPDIAGAY
jgi:hypothetical protein